MPKRKSINTSSPSDFEPKRKNPISLGSDSNIDNDFKPLKIGDVSTGLEFSKNKILSSAEEFVTLKEKTEHLKVSKITGNKSAGFYSPQVIIQSDNATDSDSGLWFNVFTSGMTFLKANGTFASLSLEAISTIYNACGNDDSYGFVWNRGSFESGTQVNVANLYSTGQFKIREASNAVSDDAGYGQIWIKNETPNELYFTNDAGNDIQITSGSGLAGSGGGDITSVVAGVGLSGGGTSSDVTLTLDMSELTDMTASVNSSEDELIILDNGADRRKLISEIPLSAFNNDSGFVTATLTDEQVQDKVGAMFSSNTETLITATYQDGDGTIDLVVDNDLSNYDNSSSGFITATLTTEQVQDIVGAMFSSNTETRISATYQDGDGTIDLVVDDMTADTNTNQLTTFTVSATTDSNATTISQGDDLMFAAGTGITCETTADGTVTITNTVTNTDTQLSTEQVQDIVGAMFTGNTETNTAVTYQDGDGTIDVVTTLDGAPLTTEAVQDIVGAMFTSNTETRIAATYEDGDGTIDLVVDDMTANTQLTSEEVQDIVGAMFTSNTETRISATYEDGDGTIDLVVDDMTTDTNTNQLTTFTLTADSGSNQVIAHGNTLDIAGSSPIVTAVGATDTVTISLDDPVNLTELNESTDATDDKILLWDESGSAWKYMTLDNLQDSIDTTGGGGGGSNYVTNDADDTMVGALTIDKNKSGSSTTLATGLTVDYDRTDTPSSGLDRNQGITLTMDLAGATGSGSQFATGIASVITFSAHGGSTVQASAGYFECTGADTGLNRGIGIKTGDDTSPDLIIYSPATALDYFQIATGTNGATTITTVEDGGDSNADLNLSIDGSMNFDVVGTVEFDGCGVGFDLVTPTYNASDTNVDFLTGNKQFVTFGAGNIADLNLIFPKTSGNFTLILKQDGSGSRTVTNYKVWDRTDSNAASGSATVLFAGGSNPTLTTAANKTDIISFFYDADNEIAYGVASLNF